MQLGKMYLVKEYFWYVFPTKKLAGARATAVGWAAASRASPWAANNAKVLSERYKCNVFVVEENTCFVLLEVDDDYCKLLDSNGNIGWIYHSSKDFELVKE